MVPTDLTTFNVACMGASASFIGLLFVGLSVVMQKGNQTVADADRVLAEGSYSALINIFFVSLVATLPGNSVGIVGLIMSSIGLLSCWRLRPYSRKLSFVVSAIVYLLEFLFSLELFLHSNRYLDEGTYEGIIIALFSMGLIRAWGLTGIRVEEHKSK